MVNQIGINADSGTINGDLTVLEKMLHEFEQAGFPSIEIPVHGLDCIINGKLEYHQVSLVKHILGKYSFSYTVHAPDALNLAAQYYPETHLEALQATIDFASEINAKIVVYHGSWKIGGKGYGESKPTASPHCFNPINSEILINYWEDEIERLEKIASYAKQRGIIIAVENIFRQNAGELTYRIDPRQLATIVSAVDSPFLRICFDFGHAFISAHEEGLSIEHALKAVLPYLAHVHIHDNFGRQFSESSGSSRPIDMIFQGMGDLHLVPGMGSIPYQSLFPIFMPQYQGVLMMEIHPRFKDRYEMAINWAENIRDHT
ncbi:MAG TPA: sugar phosphate isomerase/epimerase [Rectinema sp.]|nr:sugar phosphate isomerase/epimerase [Rectinema sp.]